MPKLTPSVGSSPQVSFEARERIVHVVRAIDSAFDQNASGADDLRVFGNQRPLLCRGGSRSRREQQDTNHDSDAETSRWFAVRATRFSAFRMIVRLSSDRQAAETADHNAHTG